MLSIRSPTQVASVEFTYEVNNGGSLTAAVSVGSATNANVAIFGKSTAFFLKSCEVGNDALTKKSFDLQPGRRVQAI